MKQNLVTLLIIFVSTMAIRAQNIPEIRIDESSGRIDAVFNIEQIRVACVVRGCMDGANWGKMGG